ncbi:hypothetical protein ACFPYI_07665 [Halomarina salina]|uniref:DUF7282 domain-containing protein n=1 Tax=Halomarina salina TaxID=1872699 RepID=A0ABD5RLI2_9EURY|nr:hypothetical protein [Halomarina salina]
MRRPPSTAVLACCCLLVLATVPFPVSAHSNHLTATSQVSAEGSVVVESVFASQPAHLVVHADDGGELGEALGSTRLAARGMQRNVEVAVDDDAWRDWGENRTVWVALHATDGDGKYDADDPVFTLFDEPVAERIAVGKGEAALVTGRGYLGQSTASSALSVGRATLPEDGLLVVRDDETDAVVGTRALPAGTHEDVTVDLNASYVASQSGSFTVRTQLYRDDGDGTLGDADRPILAGEVPVQTVLPVTVAESGANGTDSGANTPTPPSINTPDETAAGGDSSPTAGESSPTAGTPSAAAQNGSTDSGGVGPGFGVVAALTALVALVPLVWFGSRNRR